MPTTLNPPVPSRPRVALIGVDGYARVYLGLLQAAHDEGRIEMVAATVIERELHLPAVGELRRRGVPIHPSFDAMFQAHAGQIDLCLIPTGIPWHARMSIAALNAGANVLVEKPLAGSLADAEAVVDAERKNGRWVAVGFQDMYVPEVEWLKNEVVGGRIGRLESVSLLGLWPRSRGYFGRNQWAGRLFAHGAATCDSPLNNALAHFANLALYVAGPTAETSAEIEVTDAELLRAHRIESFDTAVIRGRSKEGVQFWIGVSHACRNTREPDVVFEGTEGRAEWRHDRDCLIASNGSPPEQRPVPSYARARQAMFDAVLGRLHDPSTRICGTSIAIRHTALIDAIHRRATIRPLASNRIEWCPDGGEDAAVPAILGIEEVLERAHAARSSLAEIGFEIPMGATP